MAKLAFRTTAIIKTLLVPLLLICGCAESPPERKHAKVEIVGMGGNCLKCGKGFIMPIDPNGVVILTPLCQDCQGLK